MRGLLNNRLILFCLRVLYHLLSDLPTSQTSQLESPPILPVTPRPHRRPLNTSPTHNFSWNTDSTDDDRFHRYRKLVIDYSFRACPIDNKRICGILFHLCYRVSICGIWQNHQILHVSVESVTSAQRSVRLAIARHRSNLNLQRSNRRAG